MTELKPIFTVSELNEYVDLMLSRDPFVGELTVTGEISAFKRHTRSEEHTSELQSRE